jgi:hypothetical protein
VFCQEGQFCGTETGKQFAWRLRFIALEKNWTAYERRVLEIIETDSLISISDSNIVDTICKICLVLTTLAPLMKLSPRIERYEILQ